ncbi:PAS domain-containing protein [uncultured Methanoregula sp.]|uniref:PAS domain-containing protein n=1 Tax=uncultured Methanoregula sp. TaxID=1005933 RepID=UPI002AAB4B4D|nr:PAS domain-containing protein [uncultured Methanoregula sp.]
MDTASPPKKPIIPWRHAVLLGLSVMVLFLTVYCLQKGTQTVFTHVYYIPIILASYWYQKKGVLYSAVMGFIYLGFVIFLTGYNPFNVIGAVARVICFIVIAAVVMVLSMRISSQKADLEQSEAKFHGIWNHIQAAVIILDAKTHEIVAANPEAERLTGYPEQEMKGKICHRFICPAENGKCPITDLGMTIDRSERMLLNRNGNSVPVLKTVKAAVIDNREVLIESYIETAAVKGP